MSVLKVTGGEARYGQVVALSDVHVELVENSISTVIGPNGAGKSTLLNGIMGLLDFRGSIFLEGEPIHDASVEERVELGLSVVPEQRALFGALSVEDNLLLGGFPKRHEGRQRALIALEEVYGRFERLKERRKQLASTLSGGERQMLAIGRGLMARPKVLLLDEPSLGLAPLIVKDILQMIERLSHSGLSILLVEQNARAALGVASYAYVLENGKMALEGKAQDMKNNPEIVSSYLGA